MKQSEDKPIERHWTDNHITIGFVAWDESGSNQIGVYATAKEAKQALIEYAKTLNSNGLLEACGNCGKPYGSHHGGTSPWPRDYCPDPDERMDWKNGPGTCFKPTDRTE